jgi:hypothetical protein
LCPRSFVGITYCVGFCGSVIDTNCCALLVSDFVNALKYCRSICAFPMMFMTLLAITFIAITISNLKTVFTIGSKAFSTFMKVPIRTISP